MTTKALAVAVVGAVIVSVPASAEDKTAVLDPPMYLATESLESCLKRWDVATNMTKEQWRESCKRVSAERGAYLKEQGVVPDGE